MYGCCNFILHKALSCLKLSWPFFLCEHRLILLCLSLGLQKTFQYVSNSFSSCKQNRETFVWLTDSKSHSFEFLCFHLFSLLMYALYPKKVQQGHCMLLGFILFIFDATDSIFKAKSSLFLGVNCKWKIIDRVNYRVHVSVLCEYRSTPKILSSGIII